MSTSNKPAAIVHPDSRSARGSGLGLMLYVTLVLTIIGADLSAVQLRPLKDLGHWWAPLLAGLPVVWPVAAFVSWLILNRSALVGTVLVLSWIVIVALLLHWK